MSAGLPLSQHRPTLKGNIQVSAQIQLEAVMLWLQTQPVKGVDSQATALKRL